MGYVFAIVSILIIALSVLGNLLTIVAVFKTRTIRSRYTYLLTTSLAFCDLLFSVLICPVNQVSMIMEYKELDTTLCRINGFLAVLFGFVSIFTLSFLSLDRYIAIVKPFRYDTWVTFDRVKILVTSAWIFAAILATIPLSGWGNYIFYPRKGFCFIDYKKDIGVFILFGFWFFVSFAIVSFSYYQLFKTARKKLREIRSMSHVCVPEQPEVVTPGPRVQQQRYRSRTNKQENKAAFTIFAIVGAFVVCWLPFIIVNFWSGLTNNSIPKSLDYTSTLLVAASSSVNPLLYGWLDLSFRSAFKQILSPIFPSLSRRTVVTLPQVLPVP